MKFKIIFGIFNAIIIFSFLFIFLMPFFILGWDYTQVFWAKNWFLGIIFVAIMAVLNGYFFSNWKLFGYLEREDWSGLTEHLENRIIRKNKFRNHEIKILINTYVVRSNTDGILALESHMREQKPKLLPRFALQLGVPHLLKNDPVDMEIYFGELKELRKCSDRRWIEWNYAFALMLQQKTEEAKSMLRALAEKSLDPVLMVLTLYLLDAYSASDVEIGKIVSEGKSRIHDKRSYHKWHQEVENSKGNLQVLVLAKLVQDATDWLYPEKKASAEGGTGA